MMETNSKAAPRSYVLLMVLTSLAVVALVIDLMDGYLPKAMTTAGLVVALVGLLLQRVTQAKSWTWLAIAGLLLLLASAIYRFALYQGWLVA